MKTLEAIEPIQASFHKREHIAETEAYIEYDITFTVKTYVALSDEERERLMERLRKAINEF